MLIDFLMFYFCDHRCLKNIRRTIRIWHTVGSGTGALIPDLSGPVHDPTPTMVGCINHYPHIDNMYVLV